MKQNNPSFQRCTRTVMDNIADPYITFDDQGICNYYYEYEALAADNVLTGIAGKKKIGELVRQIKKSGRKYDCITGVSGGVDSTYLVLQAKKLGLNPLLVHFDNGWNSELAVSNIQNIISRLGFDLYTLVVDWEEFRDLQLSYIKANVVDIEALTDHAIIGTLYKLASENGIKYILSGNNIVTEGILPQYWNFNKTDGKNIKAIHREFGSLLLKTYPFFSTYMKRYYINIKSIEIVSLLDYMEYNARDVKEIIAKELGWRDYGGKHYESVFTRFYQGYILPVKFEIDKRKAHLSTLICSGQISREMALQDLEKPVYDRDMLASDKEFVLKKLGLTIEQFEEYLNTPRREHTEFEHERGIWDDIPAVRPLRPVWKLIKKFRTYGKNGK
jgi:N-acetyl sugar amidotransferase